MNNKQSAPSAVFNALLQMEKTGTPPHGRLSGKLMREILAERLSLEELPDSTILRLTKIRIPAGKQKILTELLEKNQEGLLSESEKQKMDSLIEDYDQGLLIKSEALSVAVARGLIESLSK